MALLCWTISSDKADNYKNKNKKLAPPLPYYGEIEHI